MKGIVGGREEYFRQEGSEPKPGDKLEPYDRDKSQRYMSAVGITSELLGVGLIASGLFIQDLLYLVPGMIAYGFGRGTLLAARDRVEEKRFKILEERLKEYFQK